MTYVGMDCATKLTADLVSALKAAGVTHVARYLGTSWKGLTADEVKAISDSGIKIVSVFETNPTKSSYFTADQGKQDAQAASKYANDLGQPHGTAIYFAVDYDAQGKDLGAILDYFNAIIGELKDYKVGAYGSYAVMQYLKQQSKIEYFFQTYAWSNGQVCDFAHLYQYQNGVNIAGVNADRDKVLQEPGAWAIIAPKAKTTAAPSTTTQKLVDYIIKPGDTLSQIAANHDTSVDHLVSVNKIKDPNTIFAGHKIKVPAVIGKIVEKLTEKHVKVKKGDTLSGIASDNGLTLSEIEKLNPQIKDPDVIHPGDKVRVN
ncbi:DUF1906 domain-containing protein [Pullulanibacillus sp. KACC 23026]|uniref:glycoside hydrolase domain-containing protein n=1 Tax=Pullulanibacillus sp. KACC 23026 TaxID=3028315 RepID=UPI0023B1AF24|nr:glycoside hydrolase domain-containing protein [Pullulanibacillus sp. KACC 23026]WEG14171.1 DUF1906 domain-containing protein [Pullulanibacillus sp. KACC 23026]